MSSNSKKTYLRRLSELVFQYLLQVSEEELKSIRKQDIEEVVNNIEILLRELSFSQVYELSERFSLEFSLKCFTSPWLEKR